jgi:hypothetical protein
VQGRCGGGASAAAFVSSHAMTAPGTGPTALGGTPLRPARRLWESRSVTSDVRFRRVLAVAALLAGFGMALPRFLTHGPYPRLGAVIGEGGVVQRVLGPPARGMLQPGDQLLTLNGLALADPAVRTRIAAEGWPRGPLDLEFERGGVLRRVTLPPTRLTPWERFRLQAYPIAVAVLAPLVAFLLVWRRPDLGTAWVFLWYATLDGLGVLRTIFPHAQVHTEPLFQGYLLFYDALVLLYPASFVHFMSVFPRPRWRAGSRARNPWFWLTLGSYALPLLLLATFGDASAMPSEVLGAWYPGGAAVIGTASLLLRYSRAEPGWSPTTAQRVLAVVVAIAMLVSNLGFGGDRVDPLLAAATPTAPVHALFTVILALWLATPILLSYLIADDALFDPRRLIVGGLPYALLTGLLAAIYLAIVLGGQRLFATVTGEQALVFNVTAALILAFAFAPLRERLQRAIARLYGRDPEALRAALDAAGDSLLSAFDRDEVRNSVENGIERGLHRRVAIRWPAAGPPAMAEPAQVPDFARGPIDALLKQAGVRLDNLRLTAERAAATRAELRALQAQVQPHFLFNALNALAYLIETDPMAAQRFTGRLADMLRYTVEAGRRQAALLSDELAFVEDYLGVARERYENPLHFRYRGDPSLLSSIVPPLLLQPLVENSLKHGVSPNGGSLRMTLDARLTDGWFELEFADDGVPHGNGTPSLGVGLENLELRVRHFAGPNARVQATPRGDGGFAVRMAWPIPTGGSE